MYRCLKVINTVISECQLPLESAEVSSDVTCNIQESCTGIDMCLYVPVLNRNIHAYLILHDCNKILEIGIELHTVNVTFDDIEWGKFDRSHFTPMYLYIETTSFDYPCELKLK